MDSVGITLEEPLEGFVFEYSPRLTAFEFKNASAKQSDKVILFVGGLTDGLLTVPYLPLLSKKLDKVGWTLVQILFSSSYTGWGTGSLKRDAEEISRLVKYLRSEKGGSRSKIVLMGHSTGCQDTIQYLTKLEKTSVDMEIDAGIIQAPASDREAIYSLIPKEEVFKMNEEAQEFVKQGKADEVLPKKFSDVFLCAPLSAYRWLSFAEVEGDDDFFSSDLTTEYLQGILGKVSKPLLVLYSGADEFVPEWVDKQKLVDKWKTIVDPKYWSEFSRVVKGAKHAAGPNSEPGAQDEVVSTAAEFVKNL